MIPELLEMLRRYDMVSPGDRVVCALSGGADSVALLFALYLLREKLGITLEAAHFNHGLRGEESDRDEAFVRELCHRYDIPLHVAAGKVAPGDKGLEAAAREARYAFFQTLPGKLATAHTADDNAETVLMRLVRGTGLKGLGGITPVRGRIIRPMLLVTRQQVEAFLQEYCLGYVHDSSNDTDDFLRNRLRRRALPLLREENPRLSRNLSQMALGLREDEAALVHGLDFSQGLALGPLLQLPPGIQNRALRDFLEYAGVREPEAAHVELLRALVCSDRPSARASFPGGVTLCREYQKIRVLPARELPQKRILACPGVTRAPELGLRIICREARTLENGPWVFTVEPSGQVVLRFREPGDAIRLAGGTRSLKKLFIDRRIPAHQRDRIPVLADDIGILGVAGIGPDVRRTAGGVPAMQIIIEKERAEDLV